MFFDFVVLICFNWIMFCVSMCGAYRLPSEDMSACLPLTP